MPKIIQNYTLHEQIGEGQYGKVFRGIDSRNSNSAVAVKVINVKKFKDYPKLQQCTLNEIEVLSKVDSLHIVKFIEILKTANNFYFFYQFCNQGTLEEVIKIKGGLPQYEVIDYLTQILQGFKVLSSRNIMHRDLKPSNILLNDGKIKLADFGFCKSLQSQRDLAQTMLGSPIYMAPQVLKGQIYTIKADIWSLGVVIYEMIYGFCPFQERSIARLINLLDQQEVSFNQEINKISPDLQELIKKMLVKDHFKRITWDQIFNYKINGTPLFGDKGQLKEMKNFNHAVNSNLNTYQALTQKKIPFRPSYDSKNDQTSSDTKALKINPLHNGITPTALFKKKNTTTNKENTQNISLPISSIPISKEFPKILHEKIKSFSKLIVSLIQFNYCPDLTIQICLKIYNILAKQHNKLPFCEDVKLERQKMNEVIKLFQEESLKTKGKEKSINGPILTHYIKTLQSTYKDSFSSNGGQSKQLLIHSLQLLQLNDISSQSPLKQYSVYNKQKLISELYQRVIRNVI